MNRIPAFLLLALLAFVAPVAAQSFYALPAVDGQVNAFAAYGNTLYIGGSFTTVGGEKRSGLAAIDLTTGQLITGWDPNPTFNGSTASIVSITVSSDGTKIYFGGLFDKVGSTARTNVAAVDTSGTLQSFAPALNDGVSAVLEYAGTVTLIGNFTKVDGSTRVGFAIFDNTGTLTSFDAGLATYSTGASFRGATLSPDGSRLYVSLGNSAGDFKDANGNTENRRGFVVLNTTTGWETTFEPAFMDSGFAGGTFAVAAKGNALYIGGPFDTADGYAVDRLAGYVSDAYDAAFSPAKGTGPDAAVRSIGTDGNTVYLAGSFNNIGTTARTGLVALDAKTGDVISTWDAQSSITFANSDTVLFVHGGKVFVGGSSLNNASTLLGQNIQYYGAVTGVPTPTPTPTPTPKPAAPKVKISGPATVKTTKASVIVSGTATGSVTSVTYRVGSAGAFKPATGKTSWKFTASLKKGANVISVVAKGPGGSSAPAKVTVTRK